MTGSRLGRAARTFVAVAAAGAAVATFGATGAGAATLQVCSTCTYPTIQSAINAAATELPGTVDTISVGAGTYEESIKIPSGTSVSIVGAGVGKTTIEADPATIDANAFTPAGGSASYPIIFDDQAPVVSISHLTIDGMDDGSAVTTDAGTPFVGIAEYNSNLTVNDIDVTDMADAPPDATATGDGIDAVNDEGPTTRTLAVANSVISGYQQDGILVSGNSNLAVDIVGNTVTGDGGPANAEGIAVSALRGDAAAGPSGTIADNTVAGNVSATVQSPLSDDSVNGAGIRLSYVSAFTVSGNSASDNDVDVWSSSAPGAAVTVSDNTLEDSTQADALAGYGTNVFTANTVGSLANASETPIGILVADYEDDPAAATATVTANTITATDSAVEVAEGTTPGALPPSATITNNALFGNTNGVTNASPAAVDAVDNWWGCNGGPGANGCPDILLPSNTDGPVTAAPYLMLDLSAAPSSIVPGATATVIASIRQDSGGTSFSSGSFPSGLPLAITTSAGSVASSATIVDGQAALTLSGTPLGTATVTGTLNSQSATTTLTTANAVSTASSTSPTTVTVTVPVATKLAPIIDFFSSASLSLLARNPGSELALTCVDGCSASVTGKIAVAERHGKHKALRHLTLQLAPQPLTLAADGSTLYDLALTGSQRSTLSKATSATLTLTVSAKDDSTGQTVTDSKSFTLTRT